MYAGAGWIAFSKKGNVGSSGPALSSQPVIGVVSSVCFLASASTSADMPAGVQTGKGSTPIKKN